MNGMIAAMEQHMTTISGLTLQAEYFSERLIDLGDVNPGLHGIFVPEPEVGIEAVGITEQFLDNAEIYHQKYTSDDLSLARSAEHEALLRPYGFASGRPISILDIGAGSGSNTLVPLARMFPGSDYIATDLSPNLLAILRQVYKSSAVLCNLLAVCTDASRDYLKAERFDLVIGSSILHHLIDPVHVLKTTYRVLKPGGVALFFEPFEPGHAVMATAFKQILARQHAEGALAPSTEKVLRDMLLDWTVRIGRDKSDPMYPHLDDKWLFTETYINDVCGDLGFEPAKLMRRPASVTKFHEFVVNILHLHSGLPASALPDWAWEAIDMLDLTFSPDFKEELRLEEWLSLHKPA